MTDPIEHLNAAGRELLGTLAEDPDDECWRQFDALFYPAVWRYVRDNHALFARRVSRYLGLEAPIAADVLAEEVDEVAHEATKVALRRVRQSAVRFDPNRGTPLKWVFGAAEYAYVELAKGIVAVRRLDMLDIVAPADLAEIRDPNPTTEEHAILRLTDVDDLADAARHVSEKEFAAIRLVVTLGYSYADAAEVLFQDRAMTKQVSGLLERGKRELAAAWSDRKPSPRGASGSSLSHGSDDMEGTDG